MMRTSLLRWVRVLFGGGLLLATLESGCLSDALREASEDLDELANDLDGEDNDDVSEFFGDLEELFD